MTTVEIKGIYVLEIKNNGYMSPLNNKKVVVTEYPVNKKYVSENQNPQGFAIVKLVDGGAPMIVSVNNLK